MLPTDRVLQLDQWQITTEPGEHGQAGWVRLTFLGFPGTLAFRLLPDEALDLADTLTSVVKQYTSEGRAGPLSIVVTDYHTPPRSRVLQLQFAGPFPGECSVLLTDIAAKRIAAQLTATAQRRNAPPTP